MSRHATSVLLVGGLGDSTRSCGQMDRQTILLSAPLGGMGVCCGDLLPWAILFLGDPQVETVKDEVEGFLF